MTELSAGFETNLNVNAERKRDKYRQFTHGLSSDYHDVRFINLSLSALGVFSNSCEPFIDIIKELDFEKQHKFYSSKTISYYHSIDLLYILHA